MTHHPKYLGILNALQNHFVTGTHSNGDAKYPIYQPMEHQL